MKRPDAVIEVHMKTRKSSPFVVSLAALFTVGIGAESVQASTGCFTDTIGHPYETYICWLFDNGISNGISPGIYSPASNVTRGQMAIFLERQAEVPPSTGDVLISAGFANWHPFNSTDPLAYTYFSSQTQVTRTSIGSSFLSINPDIPAVLYGRGLSFKAVQFCYDTFTSTSLNYVEINTYSHTTGALGRNLRFSDPTTRNGNECRLYTLPSPVVLTANDGVNFFIQVNWAVASSQFALGRTTFVFAPTTSLAPSPTSPEPPGSPETTLSPLFDTSAH